VRLRGRRLLVLALVALIVVPPGVVAGYYVILQQSRRPERNVETLLPALSAGVAYLGGTGWQRTTRAVPGAASGAAEDFKQPSADAYVTLELAREDGPAYAEWAYRSGGRKNALESDYPGLVRELDVSGLHADTSSVLCGNIQRSATADLEKCGIWIYWARYGQYLLSVDTYQDAMSATEVTTLIRSIDANLNRALAA
jgi:hypothetical protein